MTYDIRSVGSGSTIIMNVKDTCYYDEEPDVSYIMWKNKGQTSIAKVSTCDCFVYDTIQYNLNQVWNFYFKNKTVLKKEKIFSPEIQLKTYRAACNVDHYSYTQILIQAKKDKFIFTLNHFYLTKWIEGKLNLNHYRNTRTLQYRLQVLIEKEVKKIESEKLIQRRLRPTYIGFKKQ